ncbi:MAG: methyltransferase FkbM family [Chitinophagaceae bacterium]|nr:methyltransferase FkbM family [Chitinophagaceae bacterium]
MTLLLKVLFKNAYYFLKHKNQRVFHWLVFLHGDSKRFSKKQVSFLGYSITVADPLSFVWQFKEIFADEIYYFESNKKNPLIYDCGSNIGMSCLYFKELFPGAVIKAFEADPAIAKLLDDNIKRNNLQQVDLIDKAVWIHNDGVEMASDGADGGSIMTGINKVNIPSVRLRDLLDKENSIDFLKMDIEGAEIDVIQDCATVLSKIKNLFIEYHSYSQSGQDLHTLLSILHSNGFRYYTLPVNLRRKPFANRSLDKTMDFQVNIFAYQI